MYTMQLISPKANACVAHYLNYSPGSRRCRSLNVSWGWIQLSARNSCDCL